MNFIIGVILFILILRLFFWLVMFWLRKKIQKVSQSQEHAENEPTSKPNRKKIIEKDKGDYVDFEELE